MKAVKIIQTECPWRRRAISLTLRGLFFFFIGVVSWTLIYSYFLIKSDNAAYDKILPKEKKEKRVVFLGDSLTAYGHWDTAFKMKGVKAVNAGIPGNSIEDVRQRVFYILYTEPAEVFIMVGINDLVHLKKSQKQILSDYVETIGNVHDYSPHTIIVIEGILPVQPIHATSALNAKIMSINRSLQKVADIYGYQYIDVGVQLQKHKGWADFYKSDHIHLNEKGYAIWYDQVKKYIKVK